jgi:hypothetical protein
VESGRSKSQKYIAAVKGGKDVRDRRASGIKEKLQGATAGTGKSEEGRACGRSLAVGRRAWVKLTDQISHIQSAARLS